MGQGFSLSLNARWAEKATFAFEKKYATFHFLELKEKGNGQIDFSIAYFSLDHQILTSLIVAFDFTVFICGSCFFPCFSRDIVQSHVLPLRLAICQLKMRLSFLTKVSRKEVRSRVARPKILKDKFGHKLLKENLILKKEKETNFKSFKMYFFSSTFQKLP